MCGIRHRVVALLAMQTYLEQEVERLRATGAGGEELESRAGELAMVSDELASALSDPVAAEMVAALR